MDVHQNLLLILLGLVLGVVEAENFSGAVNADAVLGQSGTQECPLYKCATNCLTGYATDANGCRTCTCISECPAIKCAACREPLIAETLRDPQTGCPVGCRCKCPNVLCPKCTSPKRIQRQIDTATNCTTRCSCVCPPPPPCAYCLYGSDPQPRSICPRCPICKPEPVCPSLNCSHDCPYGYKSDAKGCATCNCTCPIIDCARCPDPQITQVITDPVTGCSTGCRCVPPPTCPLSCEITTCPAGQIITFTDANGCTQCRCKTPPTCELSCEQIRCPADQRITVTDDNGCRQCRCTPLCGTAGQATSDVYGC